MRPTVGQILSGLALGAVAASMLVMPERFIGADDVAVTGLVLQAPDERIVVRAAPIPSRRVHRAAPRAAPVKPRVIVIERRAPVAIAVSRRIPARPRAAAPPPPPPPARKVVTQRPKPPEPAAPPPASPAVPVAIASVSDDRNKARGDKASEGEGDKAKGEKRKEKKRKKWRDDDDEGREDRRHRDEDRGDRDKDRHDKGDDDDKHGDDDD